MTNIDTSGKIISPALDVGLVPQDFVAMLAFYEKGLGMPRLDDMEFADIRLTRFGAGQGIVKFNQGPSAPEKLTSGLHESRGMKLLTIVVPDLEATSASLVKAGFDALSIEDHDQYTLAFTHDPNNTMVELVGAPGFCDNAVLNAVGLTVNDADTTRLFLTNVLGFEAGKSEELPALGTTKHEFVTGDTTLKVWQLDELPAETGSIQDYPGIRYLTALVDSIDPVVARARDAGHNIPIEPRDLAPGVQIAIIEDPDGNWFELVELA